MSASSSSVIGPWLVLAAAVLWGTTGTAQAFAPTGYDSAAIGALRLLVGGVALLFLAVNRKELGSFRDWQLRPLLLAALFVAGYQLCFFSAVAKTGVAVGTVVGIGSAPVIGGLLGLFFRGERPGRRWLIATIMAIGGCALLSLSGDDVAVDPLGIVLAIGAGASYAAYTLMIKGMLDRHAPTAVMALVVCLGALLLSPALLRIDAGWIVQPQSLLVVLHLGLASMALSYWLFARGLQTVEVSSAVTLTLAEPMTAALLGIFVLSEALNLQAFSGIFLIFAGLAVLMIKASSRTQEGQHLEG